MSETAVRVFDEADRAELHELFGRAGEGAPPDALWGHVASEAAVYLTPYADLQPDSLFLAVADGELVGYLAGCLVQKARGTGLAATLMNRWFDRLRQAGTRGCYLQTLVENARAVRFFERMGFEKYGPTPRVPGIRHRGQRLHQQTMVWTP